MDTIAIDVANVAGYPKVREDIHELERAFCMLSEKVVSSGMRRPAFELSLAEIQRQSPGNEPVGKPLSASNLTA